LKHRSHDIFSLTLSKNPQKTVLGATAKLNRGDVKMHVNLLHVEAITNYFIY